MRIETYLNVITLLLFTVSPLLAQENIQLTGTISAPSLEGISINIINSTQGTGTVNSDSGLYQILVRENDELLFSSIQYKNITVVVTSEIIKKGVLEITLIEDLNILDEVNISNISLTGNIATDISSMNIVRDMPVNIKFGDIKNMTFESDINDSQEAPRNLALESNTIMKPGVNMLGLADVITDVLGIKKNKDSHVYKSPRINSNEKLRSLFQEDFFTETLKVKKEYINDFIFYADDHGLRNLLEKPNNQLAIIDFLIEHSKGYLASRYN